MLFRGYLSVLATSALLGVVNADLRNWITPAALNPDKTLKPLAGEDVTWEAPPFLSRPSQDIHGKAHPITLTVTEIATIINNKRYKRLCNLYNHKEPYLCKVDFNYVTKDGVALLPLEIWFGTSLSTPKHGPAHYDLYYSHVSAANAITGMSAKAHPRKKYERVPCKELAKKE